MDHLEHGRECYGRRAWGDAYYALLCADQATPLQADDLDRLATTAYLTGRDLEFQRLLERLHRIHVEADDRPRAARCAFWLAVSFLFRGEVGQSNAWVARVERLVEDTECVERGYLALLSRSNNFVRAMLPRRTRPQARPSRSVSALETLT